MRLKGPFEQFINVLWHFLFMMIFPILSGSLSEDDVFCAFYYEKFQTCGRVKHTEQYYENPYTFA